MYLSRYNPLYSQVNVSIQIQSSVFSSNVSIQKQSSVFSSNVSIQIQSSVFSSMYQFRYNPLYSQVMYQFRYNPLYSQVCINPDTTLSAFKVCNVSILIQLSQTLDSLARFNTSDRNKTVFKFN